MIIPEIWLAYISVVPAFLVLLIFLKHAFFIDISINDFLNRVQTRKLKYILTTKQLDAVIADSDSSDLPFWFMSYFALDLLILGIISLLSLVTIIPAIVAAIFIIIRVLMLAIRNRGSKNE